MGMSAKRSCRAHLGARRWRLGVRGTADRGSSTVEMAILFPLIMILLFVGPQIAFWYTSKLSAEKAAAAGAREASVLTASGGEGKAAAEQVLAMTGSSTIESYSVSESRTASTVTITVTVQVVQTIPLPGFDPTAQVTITRPIERFTSAVTP